MLVVCRVEILCFVTQQVQGFESARVQFGQVQRYSGLINCMATVFRNEGMLGFFKGTQPTIIKVSLGPASSSSSDAVCETIHAILCQHVESGCR